MIQFDNSILLCPLTKEKLSLIDFKEDQKQFFAPHPICSSGLINESRSLIYPIIQGVLALLKEYVLVIDPSQLPATLSMSFDKDRVFRYYNQIEYEELEETIVYSDAKKFLDSRSVVRDYLENSLGKVKKFLAPKGKYFLDIASGPIGLKEYLDLSVDYEKRICIDISLNALIQAKRNLGEAKGIFICSDITNIPLRSNLCDAVFSQHTLYHVPKNEQAKAVHELYRVAKNGAQIAIVYNWFYHSWLMNITLLPFQIYRILRHFAGKAYVRIWPSKPRLYFFPHSYRWFERLGYGDQMKIYCWRALNTQFMRLYVHEWLFGRRMLSFVQRMEDRYPNAMGYLGDYPLIVINKDQQSLEVN